MKIKQKNPYDVREYFENRDYKIIKIPNRRATEPNFIVEKGKTQRTVDIIEFVDINKSLSTFVYDRIMKNGFFAITPSMMGLTPKEVHNIRICTKKDIDDMVKTYHVWWKRKD